MQDRSQVIVKDLFRLHGTVIAKGQTGTIESIGCTGDIHVHFNERYIIDGGYGFAFGYTFSAEDSIVHLEEMDENQIRERNQIDAAIELARMVTIGECWKIGDQGYDNIQACLEVAKKKYERATV